MSGRFGLWFVAIIAWVALSGCSRELSPGVLASFEGGEITEKELDRRILALAPEARRPIDDDFVAWHEDLVRELAVNEVLLVAAEEERFESHEDFQSTWRSVRRRILSSSLLEQRALATPPEVPTAEEVEAYFAEHQGEFARQDSREVLHLFLRRGTGEANASLSERAGELRGRVLAGEGFESVARGFSDSESRHAGGALGWVGRGSLDPQAEALVFGLEEGEISEPVITDEGVHVFMVRQVVELRNYTLDEVRAQVVSRLRGDRLADFASEVASQAQLPPDAFVPTDEELSVLLSAGDEDRLLLRIADLEVDAVGLVGLLREARSRGEQAAPQPMLRGLERQARLALLAESEGLDKLPNVAERLSNARTATLVEAFRRERLHSWVEAQDSMLRQHYADNQRRFSTPLRVKLEVLSIPEGVDPNSRMAELEQALTELEAGELRLATLADRVSGTLLEPEWFSLDELRARSSKLASIVPGISSGGYVPPHVATGQTLQMARVVAREEPQAEEFETVRDGVVGHFLQAQGADAYKRMVQDLLDAHSFQILPDRIESLPGGSLGS